MSDQSVGHPNTVTTNDVPFSRFRQSSESVKYAELLRREARWLRNAKTFGTLHDTER